MVRERIEAVAERDDAVILVGDGEPSTPLELARRLEVLALDGRIEADDYSRGGSVEALELAWAELLGKEAAVWLPTGTLANHLAVRRLCGSRPRVLVPERSHLFLDEGDALQRLSGIAAVPYAPGSVVCDVEELRAHLDEAEQGRVLNPVGAFVIESPMRRLAGQVVPFEQMEALTALARERGVGTHLDGARLFMMSAATGVPARRYADLFDTVYVSLWKYLPAPFGAILAGPAALLEGLYHERRMFGGGLPSAALAAALALDGMSGLEQRHVEVMARGRELCGRLAAVPGLEPRPFEHGSNIVPLHLDARLDTSRFVACLLEDGVVLADRSDAWDAVLLAFNPTLLRRPIEALVASFESAAAAAR
ncbi:MAG: aminotransferase class I/II-fold pyridoxal phosphate-dependent enzyme [Dehalococcoidia bacterium]